jgi:hypothetical protein
MTWFDSSEEKEVSFEPIPKGVHKLTVTGVELGPNKSGTGDLLKVEFAVDGQGERKLFANFNVKHQKKKAEEIGRGQLKDMCEKGGRPKLNQPTDLLGMQVAGEVIHKEYNGDVFANVKKYFALDKLANGVLSSGNGALANDSTIPF